MCECVCLCICLCVPGSCACWKSVGFPGAEVTGHCEPPDLGTGNQLPHPLQMSSNPEASLEPSGSFCIVFRLPLGAFHVISTSTFLGYLTQLQLHLHSHSFACQRLLTGSAILPHTAWFPRLPSEFSVPPSMVP